MRDLTEKHKVLAEEILKCTPKTAIAEKLGVNRATLYKWMQDPVWQAYFTRLCSEMEAARMQRLMPTLLRGVEALEVALHRDIRLMQSESKEDNLLAPPTSSLAKVVQTIHTLERADAGKTKMVPEGKPGEDAVATGQPSRIEKLLNTLMEGEGGHDPSESKVAGVVEAAKDDEDERGPLN